MQFRNKGVFQSLFPEFLIYKNKFWNQRKGVSQLREDVGSQKKGDSCSAKQKLTPGVCEFIPNEDQPSNRLGSVLFTQKIKSVNQYCDNKKTEKWTLHNRDAPTRQNLQCDSRSVWEVIRDHEDYIYGANGRAVRDLPGSNMLWNSTKFTTVRQSNKRSRSRSLEGSNDRLNFEKFLIFDFSVKNHQNHK